MQRIINNSKQLALCRRKHTFRHAPPLTTALVWMQLENQLLPVLARKLRKRRQNFTIKTASAPAEDFVRLGKKHNCIAVCGGRAAKLLRRWRRPSFNLTFRDSAGMHVVPFHLPLDQETISAGRAE